jgi:hypothetical protein
MMWRFSERLRLRRPLFRSRGALLCQADAYVLSIRRMTMDFYALLETSSLRTAGGRWLLAS